MIERRWNLVRRQRWMLIGPYLLVVATAFGGFVQLEHDRDRACHQRANDRTVLTQIVDIATTPSGGPVDLSKIPGFDTLDEPTQTYLRNLSAVLTAANPADAKPLHDRLIELLPPIHC